MGMRPDRSASILARSLSTQMTSLPRSAKTAPVTRPTYPVPTTQMFTSDAPVHSRIADGCSVHRGPFSRHQMADEPLSHHHREQQQQVEIGEEEQREPAALILGP